jgi:hypothetical protein
MELLRVTKGLCDNPQHGPLDFTCFCFSKSYLDVTCISLICESVI